RHGFQRVDRSAVSALVDQLISSQSLLGGIDQRFDDVVSGECQAGCNVAVHYRLIAGFSQDDQRSGGWGLERSILPLGLCFGSRSELVCHLLPPRGDIAPAVGADKGVYPTRGCRVP